MEINRDLLKNEKWKWFKIKFFWQNCEICESQNSEINRKLGSFHFCLICNVLHSQFSNPWFLLYYVVMPKGAIWDKYLLSCKKSKRLYWKSWRRWLYHCEIQRSPCITSLWFPQVKRHFLNNYMKTLGTTCDHHLATIRSFILVAE